MSHDHPDPSLFNHEAPLALRTADPGPGGTEIDVGCGSGEYLCQAARFRPERTFVGIEISKNLAERAAARAEAHKLHNVTIFNGEADRTLQRHFRPGSTAALHTYFPTPYPKPLGLKHQLITVSFLKQVYSILEFGGYYQCATDHAAYYQSIVRHVRDVALPWCGIQWVPLWQADSHEPALGTHWERRTKHTGRQYRLTLLK